MVTAYEANPVFESTSPQLSNLLARIDAGDLAIPDFQRDFVWDSSAILELIQSVMSRHPAGSILAWRQDPQNPALASRRVAGSPTGGSAPNELVLDGQQRLTALYRALSLKTPEAYFTKLSEFVNDDLTVKSVHEVDWDRAVFVVDAKRYKNSEHLSEEWQFSNDALPLFELPQIDDWLDDFARYKTTDHSEESKIKSAYRRVRDTYLIPLRSYGFPVISLPIDTPIQAVCTIFETLNRTGRPLGAFELVTARLYPQGVRLRDLWDQARQQYDVFDDFAFEPYSLLQAVCLRARGSAQRADVLKLLAKDDISTHWDPIVRGMAGVIGFLESECGVLSRKLLPYGMLVAPMAAVWLEVSQLKPIERGIANDKLKKYFWCTTFMGNFDQGANSQAGADYKALEGWILKEGAAPEAVAQFAFSEDNLITASARRKALLAGVMALIVRDGALDFHTALKLTAQRLHDGKVDSHHFFPRAYLANDEQSELLVNRVLIDSETNKIIGKKAPSDYLKIMREAQTEAKVDTVLQSHYVFQYGENLNDYDAFVRMRSSAICDGIEQVTGMTIPRIDDGS